MSVQGGLYADDLTTCPINCSVGDDGGAVFGACQAKERTLLAADDGEDLDDFGISVSLSGSLAVVGAPYADSAYLFSLDNADCGGIEQFKLMPLDPGAGQFGFAVAVSGDTAVVVERLSSTGYVFQKPLLGWQDMFQTARLLVPDLFNTKEVQSVAINEAENVVLLGAPEDCQGLLCDCVPELGDYDCGSVHVHHRPLLGWEDRFEDLILTAPDPESSDDFGWSVSISGSAALIGAPREDEACGGGSSCNAGAAYVMRSNATGWDWTHEAKLTAGDAQAGDKFGTSVSIKGNVALIGAPEDDIAGGSNVGSAYVFRFDPMSGQWNQEAKLTASDGFPSDLFGFSVSISGDVAIIGAKFDDDAASASGSAYVFLFDGFDWNEQGKFTASDASGSDHFGISVSIDGDRAIVGADEGEGAANNSGAAYVFEGLGDCDDTDTLDVCDIIDDPIIDCCPPPDCCEVRRKAGCSISSIESCVCGQMPECCTNEWTAACVDLVEGGDPLCGSCEPTGNGIIDVCEGCPADFDDDGVVGPIDLATLLGAWGLCNGCDADLDGDCIVGPIDLATLLGSWGPCVALPAQGGGSFFAEGARRFVLGGGGGNCLPLEAAAQMMGFDNVGDLIDWILSSVPADMVYQVGQFLLWLLTNWPC